MSWNDERVALLKKLWAEGLSASQIAMRIGGMTRSAIIGKVHRLGLSGRATTSRNKQMRSRKYAGPAAAAKPAAPKPTPTPIARVWRNANPNSADFPAAERKVVEPYREPPTPRVFDPAKMVRTIDLEDNHCRWPIGDPRLADFRHCGEDRVPGLRAPYCIRCARLAFSINATGTNLPASGQTQVSPSGERGEVVEAAPGRKLEDA